MSQVHSNLFDELDNLPQEYFDFISEIDRLSISAIEAQFLLDEIYEYIQKSVLQGNYKSIAKGRKAAQKAAKFQKEILDSEEVFSQIVRYIDDQDDFLSWNCLEKEDFYNLLTSQQIKELVYTYGDDKQKLVIEQLLAWLDTCKEKKDEQRITH